ncbi:MAG: biotin--[acetyl-CoA-carboxylase] ligase [Mycobacteriales bacterium]
MPPAYSDLERPPLSGPVLTRSLVREGTPWTQVRVVGETVSTHADVSALARAGQAEGLVLVAESQTGGRGRLDRAWVSPPQAGLTFSVLLRPDVARERWGWLPLVAGVAVARAVATLTEVEAVLKWPNDVLVGTGRRKVAGLLAEVSGDAVVVGAGVNVLTRPAELPTADATSLAIEGASVTDRSTILVAILRALAADYTAWCAGADVRAAYLAVCDTVGRSVRVAFPDGTELHGVAMDVDDAGRLVVSDSEGTLTAVAAGDVVHVRSAGDINGQ